jgi:hypothetical protein
LIFFFFFFFCSRKCNKKKAHYSADDVDEIRICCAPYKTFFSLMRIIYTHQT